MSLKKCKECGKEISTKAQSCPGCGAVLKTKTFGCLTYSLVLFLGLIALLIVGVSRMSSRHGSGLAVPHIGRQFVSLEAYEKIETGMSYRNVVAIVGAEGQEIARSKINGVPDVMESIETVGYEWVNGGGSNMHLIFQNDKLTQKAQMGLEYSAPKKAEVSAEESQTKVIEKKPDPDLKKEPKTEKTEEKNLSVEMKKSRIHELQSALNILKMANKEAHELNDRQEGYGAEGMLDAIGTAKRVRQLLSDDYSKSTNLNIFSADIEEATSRTINHLSEHEICYEGLYKDGFLIHGFVQVERSLKLTQDKLDAIVKAEEIEGAIPTDQTPKGSE